ncbi:MAG: hypothetical protein HY917_02755 [Candidatus Diapherotrites archaeon]|nr:hypothetical protein [Candidatus Diapherotrites archaeon]
MESKYKVALIAGVLGLLFVLFLVFVLVVGAGFYFLVWVPSQTGSGDSNASLSSNDSVGPSSDDLVPPEPDVNAPPVTPPPVTPPPVTPPPPAEPVKLSGFQVSEFETACLEDPTVGGTNGVAVRAFKLKNVSVTDFNLSGLVRVDVNKGSWSDSLQFQKKLFLKPLDSKRFGFVEASRAYLYLGSSGSFTLHLALPDNKYLEFSPSVTQTC